MMFYTAKDIVIFFGSLLMPISANNLLISRISTTFKLGKKSGSLKQRYGSN